MNEIIKRIIEHFSNIYNNSTDRFIEEEQYILSVPSKIYFELTKMKEESLFFIEHNFKNSMGYVSLLGYKIPVVIDEQLPTNIDYVLQSRKNYERIEHQKLSNKFSEMFDTK